MIFTVPICAVVAVPDACSSVAETYVVVSDWPPNVTAELGTKPLPVSVSPKLPAAIVVGATAFKTGTGFCRVTALVAFCVASLASVAVTETVFGVGKLAGAVYIPFASTVPTVAFPPATEFTDQFTLVFVEPLTVAAKASVDPARTVAVAGATVTLALPLSGDVGVVPLPCGAPIPAQPLRQNTRSIAGALQFRFTSVPPLDLDDHTSPQDGSDQNAVAHTCVSTSVGIGRYCLGKARLENASGCGYWPRDQNEVSWLFVSGLRDRKRAELVKTAIFTHPTPSQCQLLVRHIKFALRFWVG
jgi:hypothetical protein